MTVYSSTGTRVYISTAKPSAFTQTAYAALTWTEIGEVTDAGEVGGERATISHKTLAGGTKKRSGALDPGSATLEVGADSDDAGQIIAKTIYDSGAVAYFKVAEYESGDVHYGAAIVTSMKRKLGKADEIISTSIKLDMSSEGGVGWLTVNGTAPA